MDKELISLITVAASAGLAFAWLLALVSIAARSTGYSFWRVAALAFVGLGAVIVSGAVLSDADAFGQLVLTVALTFILGAAIGSGLGTRAWDGARLSFGIWFVWGLSVTVAVAVLAPKSVVDAMIGS